jgi:hypothetical protein
MPITYYTEAEHKNAVEELQRQGLALAQKICELAAFDCIVGVGGSSIGGKGAYCWKCPAEFGCPYPYKQWPK